MGLISGRKSNLVQAYCTAIDGMNRVRRDLCVADAEAWLRTIDRQLSAYIYMVAASVDNYMLRIIDEMIRENIYRNQYKMHARKAYDSVKSIMVHTRGGIATSGFNEIQDQFFPLIKEYIKENDDIFDNSQLHFDNKFGKKFQRLRNDLFLKMMNRGDKFANIKADGIMCYHLIMRLCKKDDESLREIQDKIPGIKCPKLLDRVAHDRAAHGIKELLNDVGHVINSEPEEKEIDAFSQDIMDWDNNGYYDAVIVPAKSQYMYFCLAWLWRERHRGTSCDPTVLEEISKHMNGHPSVAKMLMGELDGYDIKDWEGMDTVDLMGEMPDMPNREEWPYMSMFYLPPASHKEA